MKELYNIRNISWQSTHHNVD